MIITQKEGVISQHVDDEYVLLDTNTNQYYGLSAVGARFWQLALEGKTLENIHSTLLDEFAVDAEVLREDLSALITQLKNAELINVEDNS